MSKTEVLLLMGANLEEPKKSFKQAISLLFEEVGEILALSSLHKTKPWGFSKFEKHDKSDEAKNTEFVEVDEFANQAILLSTELEPQVLLERVLEIEKKVGRRRDKEADEREQSGEKYASRIIDIDIIFYGVINYESDNLRIPHPLMQQREFVLAPMAEIAPTWRHPIFGLTCNQLLDELKKAYELKKQILK